MNKNSIKNYFSGYGHSLRLFPLNDDGERMVRFFGEYISSRPSNHDELLREQFKRVGQRFWTAIKTLPPQGVAIDNFKIAAEVCDPDSLVCSNSQRSEFNESQNLGTNQHVWLHWRGKFPDVDSSIELSEEEHAR